MSEKALKRKKKWPDVAILVVLLVFIAGFFTPVVPPRRKGPDRIKAIQNAKQIFYLLFDFETEFGSYPNEATIEEIAATIPDSEYLSVLGSDSSNGFFRQFFASDFTDTEEVFYARTANSIRPDGDIRPDQTLAKGECGFAYVVWEGVVWDGSMQFSGSAPLLITPLVPGELKFDYQLAKARYAKDAVILRADGSVDALEINKKGRVIIDGKDFFDWSQPHWCGQKPRIVWPE